MPVPAEILADVRVFLDAEIQAGRRRQAIDPAVVAEFLAAQAAQAQAPAAPRECGGCAARPRGRTEVDPAATDSGGFRPSDMGLPGAGSGGARPPAGREAESGGARPLAERSGAGEAGPAQAAAAAPDVAAVAEAVRACRLCALAATRTKAVPGVGNAESPLVMFVGEAPGRDEDLRGEPFVGRAGQLLDKMIAAMGFARSEVFIANVLKCRPPDNRTPTPEEMARCLPFLRRQIALVRPKTIVALGATAFRGLTGDSTANISKIRGLWQDFGGIPLMPTFHPAYLLRAPAAKRVVWDDLRKVLSRLGREPPPRVSGR